MKTVILTAVVLAMLAGSVLAGTTIDPAHPYAYAANAGWINASGDAAHGASIGQSYCTGSLWSANCGWISLGNGPTNGWHYSNMSATDWGVNHDGVGNLTGYAYGANIGWINFEQAQGKPKIDLRTGALSGYAYAANIGWIGFSNTEAYVRTASLEAGPDNDGDGIPDAWELSSVGNTNTLSGSGHDQDGDGVPDVNEYLADTNPQDPDDVFKITAFAAVTGTNTVTWVSRPTRVYRVEATNVLNGAAGDWEDAGGLIGPPGTSPTQAAIPSTATNRFYRVKAITPLSE